MARLSGESKMNKTQLKLINDMHELFGVCIDAHCLLEEVYNELGPYTDQISPELMEKLNNYFGFDDGE